MLARDAATLNECPRRLEYEITVTAISKGSLKQNHFRARYLPDSDFLSVSAFSDEENQHPYTPHGTNVAISFFLSSGQGSVETGGLSGLSRALTAGMNHDDPPTNILGVPELKPMFDFGLSRHNKVVAMAETATPPPTELRTIGSATVEHRDYETELLGIEDLAFGRAYHLRLTPVTQPQRFRLREIWVDTTSYAVRQIISEGNFVDGPPTRIRWQITYRDHAGCEVIDREVALGRLDYGRNRLYDEATISFSIITDPEQYRVPVLDFKRPEDSSALREPSGGP